MAINIDKVLGINGESDPFMMNGYCDFCIQGLTSGSIKLQYKLTATEQLPSPSWTDFPGASFTENVYDTLFISEHGVLCKLVGVSNNSGAYVRLAKYYNKTAC